MILVFGKNGQVSRELRKDPEVQALDRQQADLMDPAACAAKIASLRPSAVINAAAYTAVDKAETDQSRANTINGDAPAAMAEACAKLGIPFIHISTDYVFEGTGDHPQRPDQPTNPQGVYGRSKRSGELGIEAAGGTYVILRTSWVYSATGSNFVKTMLRLGHERDAIPCVADQIGGPTPASAIAEACLKIARHLMSDPSSTGIYHLSGAPDCSWADFARAIFDVAGLDCDVQDVPSTEFKSDAVRPLNSRMDCSSTLASFGIARPDWRGSLAPLIAQIKETT